MLAPRKSALLLSWLVCLVGVSPARAQLQTSWTVFDGVQSVTGQSEWDLSEGAEPWIGIGDATSQLTTVPSDRTVWLPEVLLATQVWRWISAAAPASGIPGTLDGSLSFDFGDAGTFEATAFVDIEALQATIEFDLSNVDLGELPLLQSGSWVQVQDLWTGGPQGSSSSHGCIVIDGLERATFAGTWFDDQGIDGSVLPDLRTDAALQVLFGPDDKTVEWIGDLRLGEARSIQFGVNIDVGNGPIFLGLGVASLGATADGKILPLSFYQDLQLLAGSPLLRMMDTWWAQLWAHVVRPQPAWPLGLPDEILSTTVFDLDAAGVVSGSAHISFLQDYVDVDLDYTGFTGAGLPNPAVGFDARWRERFQGVGGGAFQAQGDLYADGAHFGQYASTYAFSPSVDTSTVPNFLLDGRLRIEVKNQGFRIEGTGTSQRDEAGNLDLVHQLDLGAGGVFGTASTYQIDPRFVAGEEDPLYGGVDFTGSLQLTGPSYPDPALVILDMLDLAYWIRHRYRPGAFPPDAADSSFADFVYDFGPAGQVDVHQEQSSDTESVDSSADGELDLSLLPYVDLGLDVDVIEELLDSPYLVVGCVVADSLKQPLYLVADREVPRRKDGHTHQPFKMVLSASIQFDPNLASATVSGSARFEFLDTTTTPEPGASVFSMGPAHPNPAHGDSRVDFRLPRPGPVRAFVVDLRGRRVRELLDGTLAAGAHSLVWDGRDGHGNGVAKGTYWLRVEAAGRTLGRKIVRLDR